MPIRSTSPRAIKQAETVTMASDVGLTIHCAIDPDDLIRFRQPDRPDPGSVKGIVEDRGSQRAVYANTTVPATADRTLVELEHRHLNCHGESSDQMRDAVVPAGGQPGSRRSRTGSDRSQAP